MIFNSNKLKTCQLHLFGKKNRKFPKTNLKCQSPKMGKIGKFPIQNSLNFRRVDQNGLFFTVIPSQTCFPPDKIPDRNFGLKL